MADGRPACDCGSADTVVLVLLCGILPGIPQLNAGTLLTDVLLAPGTFRIASVIPLFAYDLKSYKQESVGAQEGVVRRPIVPVGATPAFMLMALVLLSVDTLFDWARAAASMLVIASGLAALVWLLLVASGAPLREIMAFREERARRAHEAVMSSSSDSPRTTR